MDENLRDQLTKIFAHASVNAGTAAIDRATNMFGALSDEVRERLMAVITDPNPETWDDAYSIIVNAEGIMHRTLWQAVISVDPNMPRKGGSMDAPVAERWPYVPDTYTILLAIQNAVEPRA